MTISGFEFVEGAFEGELKVTNNLATVESAFLR